MSQDSNHHAELELVRRVLDRDVEALDEFGEILAKVPRLVAARNAHLQGPLSRQELPDVVQDCLVVIWKKLPTYEGRAALVTWMYRICTWELMNAVRRVGRRRDRGTASEQAEELLREELVADAPEPDQALEGEELERAFAELDDEEASVIRLKHYEELTFDAIASRLDTSASWAKARYYRGLQQLQRILSRRWGRVG